MGLKENDMRAYYSYVTVFTMENIGDFLREKLNGYYEEYSYDGFDAKLILNDLESKKVLPDVKEFYEKNNNTERLIKIEFFLSHKADGRELKKEYALCVITYGIKNYNDEGIYDAANLIKRRVWSACHSGGSNTVLSTIIRFLKTNQDANILNADSSSDNEFPQKKRLFVLAPNDQCLNLIDTTEKDADKKLFNMHGDGSSFVFVYFSAAMGKNGDDILKVGHEKKRNEVLGEIEQAVSGDGGKNHAGEMYRRVLYDVSTFSQPSGAALIKMGHVYSPYTKDNNNNKEWERALAWDYYEMYYSNFIMALLDKADVFLKTEEIRKANGLNQVTSALEDKVMTFMGQIEELDEKCHSVIKTSPSGMAAIWLNVTDTDSMVVAKARKECSIFLANAKEFEERKKEQDKDRTDSLFSIFAVLALVSCVWDGYCLFREFTPSALFLFSFAFSIVVLVVVIVLKDSWTIIWSHIKNNWWIIPVFIFSIITVSVLWGIGVIPLQPDDSIQVIENRAIEAETDIDQLSSIREAAIVGVMLDECITYPPNPSKTETPVLVMG